MATYTNPGSSSIKPAKRTGNAGNSSKRSEFMSAKSKSGSERSQLADSVMSALEKRKPNTYITPKLEQLKANVNTGRGPTKGVKN
jgi:hypothetical protein